MYTVQLLERVLRTRRVCMLLRTCPRKLLPSSLAVGWGGPAPGSPSCWGTPRLGPEAC